jgi:hypothetical protein
MLKNAHLLRFPAASPTRRRGRKSLLIRRDSTPHPSPSANYCICLPAEASAKAGAFLSILRKNTYSTFKKTLTKAPFSGL